MGGLRLVIVDMTDVAPEALTELSRFLLGGSVPAIASAPAPPSPTRRAARVAPGSVHDRVLTQLRAAKGPLPSRTLLANSGADAGAVRKALADLSAAGTIERRGKSRATRYALTGRR